jgi:hypothetical protein
MTLTCGPHVGPLSWSIDEGLGPSNPSGASPTTYRHPEATTKASSWIMKRNDVSLFLPCTPLFPYFWFSDSHTLVACILKIATRILMIWSC